MTTGLLLLIAFTLAPPLLAGSVWLAFKLLDAVRARRARLPRMELHREVRSVPEDSPPRRGE